MNEEKYPLHEKVSQNEEIVLVLSELYDKLSEMGLHFAQYVKLEEYDTEQLMATYLSGEDFVAIALDIDPTAFSAEKYQILKDLKEMNT